MFAELGEYSQNMLIEAFWIEYPELGSRSKSSPKNQQCAVFSPLWLSYCTTETTAMIVTIGNNSGFVYQATILASNSRLETTTKSGRLHFEQLRCRGNNCKLETTTRSGRLYYQQLRFLRSKVLQVGLTARSGRLHFEQLQYWLSISVHWRSSLGHDDCTSNSYSFCVVTASWIDHYVRATAL